jgi:hypothetical protein
MSFAAAAHYDVVTDLAATQSGAAWEYLAGLRLLPSQDPVTGCGWSIAGSFAAESCAARSAPVFAVVSAAGGQIYIPACDPNAASAGYDTQGMSPNDAGGPGPEGDAMPVSAGAEWGGPVRQSRDSF